MDSNSKPPKHTQSLIEKYQIPINHFDFNYVNETTNANELEKIIQVLLSGEEGHYPELLKASEDRLREIKPTSKHLRVSSSLLQKGDLKNNELDVITTDLQNWLSTVSDANQELTQMTGSATRCCVEVRKNNVETQPLKLTKKIEKTIQATDYRAWDRYDPDTEISKMDLEEERIKSAFKSQKSKIVPQVTFNEFQTDAEARFVTNREMDKGREYFKSGDYEEALQCFTNSVSGSPTIINLNNRALTYLKLKRFPEAYDDCKKVLAIDSKNLKALLQMSQALEGMAQYEEAFDCIGVVIERDPNNVEAQDLANRVRKFCRNILRNTRMKIVEIE
ncbi:sperm-associated antigen 1 [Cylas formicarius]|uniref:sperm-associated antigen 1 n=1 Tax=Cylas formicarius TaxID=197179 RepID=UPI002958C024|nr:sperm-associated antigen 1 [Cylas formicarius]